MQDTVVPYLHLNSEAEYMVVELIASFVVAVVAVVALAVQIEMVM